MNLLEQIQAKIYELTREERARLREWFDEFDGDSWDKDFDDHVKEKKLQRESEQAKQEFNEGKVKDL
jgi:DNA-binding PadR family transcriptional regulator